MQQPARQIDRPQAAAPIRIPRFRITDSLRFTPAHGRGRRIDEHGARIAPLRADCPAPHIEGP